MKPDRAAWLGFLRQVVRLLPLAALLGLVAEFGLPIEQGARTLIRLLQVTLIGLFALTEEDLLKVPLFTRAAKKAEKEAGAGERVLSANGVALLDNLEKDHDWLLRGDVFTADVIHYWIKYKRENEVDAIRIRPHPFEDEALYRRRFGSMPNVSIDGSGNVLPAIEAAACVLHLNCGTAIESLMLGTPAVSLEFLNTETMRAHAPLPARVSIPASSVRDLEELVVTGGALKAGQAARRGGSWLGHAGGSSPRSRFRLTAASGAAQMRSGGAGGRPPLAPTKK